MPFDFAQGRRILKMFNKTPARKRKREIKKLFGIALVILMVLGIIGGGGYYLLAITFKKPLVSPLTGHNTGTALGSRHQSVPGFADYSDDTVQELRKDLEKKKIAFGDIKSASNSSYLVTLKDGEVVTFSSEKDILSQVSSLQVILSRLTMEGKLFSQLDLRFDKPVIKMR